MGYEVLLGDQPREYLSELDEKSHRIVRENLLKLTNEPYPRPGAGSGDREKIPFEGEEVYRMHIGRTHTAIYDVIEAEDAVEIYRLLPIDEAHKRYGD
jgi:mRNA-degrading endonuclease RelE of RelBE toxin-antitoxin system